jgi:hypothetical protein
MQGPSGDTAKTHIGWVRGVHSAPTQWEYPWAVPVLQRGDPR